MCYNNNNSSQFIVHSLIDFSWLLILTKTLQFHLLRRHVVRGCVSVSVQEQINLVCRQNVDLICSISFTELATLAFVVGLLVQEAMEAYRQGASIYFSKWWNVVDTLIVLTFPLVYIVWFTVWFLCDGWKPRDFVFFFLYFMYLFKEI